MQRIKIINLKEAKMEVKDLKNGMESLFQKCWKDNSVKKKFIDSPHKFIEEHLDVKLTLPLNNKIIVEDQTSSDLIYLNIPRRLNIDDFELSDEELETVSGGDIFVGVCIAAYVYFMARGITNMVKHA